MADPAKPRDLVAALLAALEAGCPDCPSPEGMGNPLRSQKIGLNQGLAAPVAQVAVVAHENDKAGNVSEPIGAEGVDPVALAERAAIAAEPPLPPPGSPERVRIDKRQRAMVRGLLAAASLRPSARFYPPH